jgi:hypothetical protein
MDLAKRESNYKAWVDTWKQKEKEVKAQAQNKPHTLATAKNRASLDREGIYRKNGFFYIRTTSANKSRRALYDNPANVPANSVIVSYGFNYQHGARGREFYNYLSGSFPYKNEAHHLLPVKAFSKKHFNSNQLKMLKKLPYCVNHGENVIFLPKQARSCLVHNLPQHNGSHPPYNAAVAADASRLAAKMMKRAQDSCDPEEPLQLSVLKEMINYQKKYWNLLIAAGAGMTVKQVGAQQLVFQSNPAVKKRTL